jgi:16S rRNA (cytosine967-C5)-methyltransferase
MTGLLGLHRAQCRLAETALGDILPAQRAADGVLGALLRRHPKLGARDRRWVNGLVYGVLRDIHALRESLGAEASPSQLVAAWLAWRHDATPDALQRLDLPPLAGPDPEALPDAARRNWLPSLDRWLVEDLGTAEADALAEALRQPAAVDLRVNRLRASRDQARTALEDAGIEVSNTPRAPLGLRLTGRRPLSATRVWRDGWVEPQEEGSQLIAALVAAAPGERVADFCAGAGGKSLAMAADMDNRGRIDAFDVSEARLRRIAARAERLGIDIIDARVLDGFEPEACYDAVLVDAPCSGTGTLRRQPELALREIDIAGLQAQQIEILQSAAALVAPGGRLIYATCSLLRAENEAVTDAFLAARPDFIVEPADGILSAQGIDWHSPTLRLFPHLHDSDGFYALRMRRR